MSIQGTLIGIPALFGLYLILSGLFPRMHPGLRRAVRARAGKKESLQVYLIDRIAAVILPHISLEVSKRQDLARSLSILNRGESPELFHARAWATGVFQFVFIMLVSPVFHLLFLALFPGGFQGALVYQIAALLALALLFVMRHKAIKELKLEVKAHKEVIEWELPQFSGTVLQSLGHTRNVIEILESYHKICGSELKLEIERTLNDMRTGNHETAINNLSARVGSGMFSQLTQGLIGLLRGEEQRSYFQIITSDFTKAQQELMRKEMLARPEKLTINNFLMLISVLVMVGVVVLGLLMDSGAALLF